MKLYFREEGKKTWKSTGWEMSDPPEDYDLNAVAEEFGLAGAYEFKLGNNIYQVDIEVYLVPEHTVYFRKAR